MAITREQVEELKTAVSNEQLRAEEIDTARGILQEELRSAEARQQELQVDVQKAVQGQENANVLRDEAQAQTEAAQQEVAKAREVLELAQLEATEAHAQANRFRLEGEQAKEELAELEQKLAVAIAQHEEQIAQRSTELVEYEARLTASEQNCRERERDLKSPTRS